MYGARTTVARAVLTWYGFDRKQAMKGRNVFGGRDVEARVEFSNGTADHTDDRVIRDFERWYDVRITRTQPYVRNGTAEIIIRGSRERVRAILDQEWLMSENEGERFTESLMREV